MILQITGIWGTLGDRARLNPNGVDWGYHPILIISFIILIPLAVLLVKRILLEK